MTEYNIKDLENAYIYIKDFIKKQDSANWYKSYEACESIVEDTNYSNCIHDLIYFAVKKDLSIEKIIEALEIFGYKAKEMSHRALFDNMFKESNEALDKLKVKRK